MSLFHATCGRRTVGTRPEAIKMARWCRRCAAPRPPCGCAHRTAPRLWTRSGALGLTRRPRPRPDGRTRACRVWSPNLDGIDPCWRSAAGHGAGAGRHQHRHGTATPASPPRPLRQCRGRTAHRDLQHPFPRKEQPPRGGRAAARNFCRPRRPPCPCARRRRRDHLSPQHVTTRCSTSPPRAGQLPMRRETAGW